MLHRANELYKEGVKFNRFALKREFNALKKSLPWMQEVNAHAVSCDAADKLNRGFKNFFEKRARHPRFHSKKKGVGSFSVTGSEIKYDREHRRVYLMRYGWIRLAEAIRFKFSKIYRVTVTNRVGKWFVSFSIEVPDAPGRCENQAASVGIDLGLKTLAVCSDGTVVPNPRISNCYAIRLRKLNKELSRRRKGGMNWWKTVYKLRGLYRRIADVRSDYLHKFTTAVVRKYGIVCLEDLNVSGMVRNRRLARSISDVSFYEIRRQFEYKAKEVRYVPRFFPSSKRCSDCGNEQEMPLDVRTYVCPACGMVKNRDLNAAINIRTFAVGSTGSKKSAARKPLASG
jgi:putative transposase